MSGMQLVLSCCPGLCSSNYTDRGILIPIMGGEVKKIMLTENVAGPSLTNSSRTSSVSTRTPDGHLHRILYQREPAHRTVTYTEYYTRENLHTGRSLTENTIPERTHTTDGHLQRILYQREPAHRMVTYTDYYTRENPHTGRSLTENTIPEGTCTPDGHLHRILYQREPAHRTVTYTEYYTR